MLERLLKAQSLRQELFYHCSLFYHLIRVITKIRKKNCKKYIIKSPISASKIIKFHLLQKLDDRISLGEEIEPLKAALA